VCQTWYERAVYNKDQNDEEGSASFMARRSFCSRVAYVFATMLTGEQISANTIRDKSNMLTSLEIQLHTSRYTSL
jgi:hypothetical protein